MDALGITEQLSCGIIRPPRASYDLHALGSPFFKVGGKTYQRLDFDVPSLDNIILKCSMFKEKSRISSRPTIVYLHANSSSRVSAHAYIKELIHEFDVVCFDFRGCGLSQGAYITLGYLEKEDVKAVIDFINLNFGKRLFMLWGRSMGAVTGLLFAAKYTGICAVVADSPFSDLEKVIHNKSSALLPLLPGFMVDSMIDSISSFSSQKIRDEYGHQFDVKRLKPINCVGKIPVPIFFIASKQDQIVNYQQIAELYEATNSYKELEVLQGGHNQIRPLHLKEAICEFLLACAKMRKFGRKRIFSYAPGSRTDRKSPEIGKNMSVDEKRSGGQRRQLESENDGQGVLGTGEQIRSLPLTRARIFKKQQP